MRIPTSSIVLHHEKQGWSRAYAFPYTFRWEDTQYASDYVQIYKVDMSSSEVDEIEDVP